MRNAQTSLQKCPVWLAKTKLENVPGFLLKYVVSLPQTITIRYTWKIQIQHICGFEKVAQPPSCSGDLAEKIAKPFVCTYSSWKDEMMCASLISLRQKPILTLHAMYYSCMGGKWSHGCDSSACVWRRNAGVKCRLRHFKDQLPLKMETRPLVSPESRKCICP